MAKPKRKTPKAQDPLETLFGRLREDMENVQGDLQDVTDQLGDIVGLIEDYADEHSTNKEYE